ncbi:MAG TPA: glycosyltransferase family 4 protein [Gemmatimonadaceae bacterium]
MEKVARSLTDAGHEVHLVARNREHRPERERLPEADVHRLKPWPMLGKRLSDATMFPAFFNPRWLSAITTTARASRAQVLLVRDLPLAPTAIWVGRRLGIPVVLDMAENYPAMLRGRVALGVHHPADIFLRNAMAAEAVERWVLARIDHVLVVVEESRDRLRALGVEGNRITVVSNTPSLSRLEELAPKTHAENTLLELIYLGLLEAPRGIGVMLEALARSRQSGIPARLTILGDGRERPVFQERARELGLDDSAVRFLGRVPYVEAVRILQTADVGVIPHVASDHWNTTIPNKLFDYMAGGLAVLTSDAKPAARVVREAGVGVVFRDTDPADCAAAIKRLADTDFRTRCGANGRSAVASRYNWEKDAGLMLEAVNRVVAERAAA